MRRRLTRLGLLLVAAGCAAPQDSVNEEHLALIGRFVDAGNAHDLAALDSLLTPDFARHSQATPDVVVENIEQFKEFQRQDQATFPDSRVTMHQLVAQDSLVAFRGTYTGTQEGPMGPFPPSGKQMQVEFFGIFRIENGRIAELWVTWDNLAALTQLGYWPPPASGG